MELVNIASNQLVKVVNNQLVTDSRQVAEAFGKRHRDVMRAIETLWGGMRKIAHTQQMFYETTYHNEQNGQDYKMYLMNRDGFSLLVMGFTGPEALEWKIKYINAFNEMEKELQESSSPALPDFSDPVVAARAWADQYEARRKAEKTIEENKPKIVLAESIEVSDTDISIGALAKILKQNGVDIGRNRLYSWMRENGYLIKTSKSWNQPKQIYMDAGYFRITESVHDSGYGYTPKIYVTTYVTGKGQKYFINKFLENKDLKPVG